MLIRVFTLSFDPLLGRFDDKPLQEFIKDKDVLAVKDHFFIKDETPYLTLVVTCHLKQMEMPRKTPSDGASKESWRDLIADKDLPLFNTLRTWRNERSKEEGIPPYVICANRQLAEIAATRPQSLAKLGDVYGFGKAKLEKYGKAILDILAYSPENAGANPNSSHQETEDEHVRE